MGITAENLNKNIYESALEVLTGKKVTDLVIGLSMLAVELDRSEISVAYVLRDELSSGCSIFSYANKLVGMSAAEAAGWLVNGQDAVQKAIASAVINAASNKLELPDTESSEHPFDLTLGKNDTVGMIGYIHPAVMRLKPLGCRIIIFDKGKCAQGNREQNIFSMSRQAELLPECDALIVSGTAITNDSAAEVFNNSPKARDIVLLGASVPMSPNGYSNTPVSVLAGSRWQHKDKNEIFTLITRAAGMQFLKAFMIKKNVRIK